MARPSRRFWFVLALALGATVGELQHRMGSREFTEWRALYQLDPFGDIRGDFQAGQVASTVVNLFSEEGDPEVTASAFLLPTPWTDVHQKEASAPEPALPVFEPGSPEEDAELIRMFCAERKES